MAVELTSPAEGKQAGESYSGPNEDWLVQNGYATRTDDSSDNHLNTTVPADVDPTLAANREEPDADRVSYGGNKVRRRQAKNAPEVGAGEPLHVEGDEPGAAPKTVHRPDLEDRAARAEADVKGVSVEELEETGTADADVTTEELIPEVEGEPTTQENVDGAAGDGQEVSDKEEPAQDGDDADGATSAQ